MDDRKEWSKKAEGHEQREHELKRDASYYGHSTPLGRGALDDAAWHARKAREARSYVNHWGVPDFFEGGED